MLNEVLTVLRDDQGIDTEPIGRQGVRFAVTGDRARPLANPVVLDLLSEEAVTWLVQNIKHQPRQNPLELAAFYLAEAVWLTDQEAAGVRSVVRLQREGDGFDLVTVEL